MRVQNTKAKLRMYMLTGGHSFARVDDLDDLRAKFVEHSIGFNFIAADFFDNGGDADAADMRAGVNGIAAHCSAFLTGAHCARAQSRL